MKVNSWKEALTAAGVSVQELADYLGCHKNFLTSVLNGKRKASDFFMRTLKRTLLIDDCEVKHRLNIDNEHLRKIIESKGLNMDELTESQRFLIGGEHIDRMINILALATEKVLQETIKNECSKGKKPIFKLAGQDPCERFVFVYWLKLRGVVECTALKSRNYVFSDEDKKLVNILADEMLKIEAEKNFYSRYFVSITHPRAGGGCLPAPPLKPARTLSCDSPARAAAADSASSSYNPPWR